MQKESLTLRQGQCLLIMFIFGSSAVLGASNLAGQDAWASLALGITIAIPIVLLYARIMKLFPEQSLYDIMETLFGKLVAKVFAILMVWYAVHLGSLVMRNFSEFIMVSALPSTPQLAVMFVLLFVTMYMARSGIQILAKWSIALLPVVLIVVVITIALSLQIMDFSNILPFLSHSPRTIAIGAWQDTSFPYAETVLFLCASKGIKKEDSPYRLYFFAVIIGGSVLMLVFLRNLFILGAALLRIEYFPSFVATSVIQVGDFLGRIEGSISLNFILAGIVKITVCLLAASRGLAKIFGVPDHNKLIVPAGLLATALGAIVYNSTMEMYGFLKYYGVYTIPFQILIPLIVWITAEIRTRKTHALKQPKSESVTGD